MTKAIDKPKQWDRLNLNVYATKGPVPVEQAPEGLILTDWGIFYKSVGTGRVSTWPIQKGQKITLLEAMTTGADPLTRALIRDDYHKTLVWPLVINDREPGEEDP